MLDPRDDRKPQTRGARPHFGKYAGIVVDNAKPEGGDHLGRIRVRVPGILEEDPEGDGSRPIEVVAAPSFAPGFFFVPEKNSQVWVEFVAGDLNAPIWTGVWYPKGAPPKTPDGRAPDAAQKILRTAADHVVLLDDANGGERIVIKARSGGTITLDASGITIETANATVTLDATGTTFATASTGGAQPAVLAPLLDWLLSHTHVGNLGSPTPLSPDAIATLNGQRAQLLSKPG